ncbi:protein of unknown function [Ruminococcaceae bacterium BL-4]|nr:protein of unknown function [Ruminococcaceae bacterium BL-4]
MSSVYHNEFLKDIFSLIYLKNNSHFLHELHLTFTQLCNTLLYF